LAGFSAIRPAVTTKGDKSSACADTDITCDAKTPISAVCFNVLMLKGFNVFSICARRAYYIMRLSLIGDIEVIESRLKDAKQKTTDLPPTET